MPNIDNIVKQLKKRKVFRSLAIYAGFAFVLIQVCSIVFPALYLPEWTMTFLVVLVIIGFPTTLVLSWIYDITPSKGEEAPSTDTSQPLGVYALTGLVLTVVGIGFWVSISVFGVSFGGSDKVPSIAIIPFDNKGAEEDEFYAYSISSELISDVTSAGLIRVAGLKNIESLEYQTMNYDDLSEKLFVRYIAHGSIWKIDSVFQLSMELYDTKTSKVLWSESWQKAWNELASIKGNLAENILKTLKVSTKQDIAKAPTTSTEAYEFFLKAKYKYEKRENMEDMEIARGLLRKAIKVDDNLLIAKTSLASTYHSTGDYGKAMEILTSTLKQAEKLGDKKGFGRSLIGIGVCYGTKGDTHKALDYFTRSLAIAEELGDKQGAESNLNNIGVVYYLNGDYDKSLDYYERSLKINEEFDDKLTMGHSLINIGSMSYDKGDLDKALDYYNRALAIHEEIGDKVGMGYCLNGIGSVSYDKGDYGKAQEYLEKSLAIQKEIEYKNLELFTTTYLYLAYKHLGEEFDVNEIHSLIKEAENIEFDLNLRLYELLEDTSYLETAYNQVQEKADNLEPDVAVKFLELPTPKEIVEEWEKVK